MLNWSAYPFLRIAAAFILGIAGYLYLGQEWAGSAVPWAVGGVLVFAAAWAYSSRQRELAATDVAGVLGLLAVAGLGFTRTQVVTESRRPDHLGRLVPGVECYRAVVDEPAVVRVSTYATTLRVQAVRVGGRWQQATGGVRVSIPRYERLDVPAPRYGDVWLVRGTPEASKGPANLGEFDYRRFLEFHQINQSQYVHPGQYRVLGVDPPNVLVYWSQLAAGQLDGVFRRYVHARREYAIGTALVLGFRDDIDQGTKQAYADTGTTHIMAVSGLQVGLLFVALQLVLSRVPLGSSPRAVLRRRLWTALLGLSFIWSYALLTGLSASVLRATVMLSLITVAQTLQRQHNLVNTLCAAAFLLLFWNPYLLCDVGFQLSFGAVLSIVYVQPRLARVLDARSWLLERRRSWQPRWVQKGWGALAWLCDFAWQLTVLSMAAQLVTFPLGLYYFHQFPFSFLLSNLVAVPISSASVYVGVLLLLAKGLAVLLGLVLPAAAAPVLDYLPQGVGWVFETMVRWFNDYIFWVGRLLPGAVVQGIHLSQLQTLLIFLLIGAVLAFLASRRVAWAGAAVVVLAGYAGSRVAEARSIAPLREFVVYSIPHRSVVGFWQGARPEFVTTDSLPLNETERTYRLKPSLILRRVPAGQVSYRVGWAGMGVPARVVALPDSAEARRRHPPAPLVLASWRGLRVAFVRGTLRQLAGAVPAATADVVVLRRNPYLHPDALAAHFGARPWVVFDSSCQRWYVARQDSALRAAGFRTWDVNEQGQFTYALPGGQKAIDNEQ